MKIVILIKLLISLIIAWSHIFLDFAMLHFISAEEKHLEILALRSQLSVQQQEIINRKLHKPRFTQIQRQFWVLLSKIFPKWKNCLVLVKPETVIAWHRTAFKLYWKRKSKVGRPKISMKTIALIKKIHRENPLLSPEKIHERLIELAVTDAPSPNTIAKYIPETKKPASEKQRQSWMTFLSNHSKDIWSMDFLTVPTLFFKVLYVFVIISHNRRRIEHFAVTTNPSSAYVIQQMREATPFGKAPKYLIHDNDSTFTSKDFQHFLKNANIKSKRTSFHSPWQNGICERLVGILRAELLNHVIPINQRHLEMLLKEYVNNYYNPERTHQSLDCRPPDVRDKPPDTKSNDTALISTQILGGLYHSYKKVA